MVARCILPVATFAALAAILPATLTAQEQRPPAPLAPYQDATVAPAARTADLLQRMTLDEKLAYISGTEMMFIRGLPRLGIPRIRMADGPQGCNYSTGHATAYPVGICTAASWNRTLAHQIGTSLGRDARARGIHIMLGPGANIHRVPQCGRNFEYAGEDPYLAGQVVVSEIQGSAIPGRARHHQALCVQ